MDYTKCELFTKYNMFTDDTVMTLATKYAIDNGIEYKDAYQLFGKKYPDAGYGTMFNQWLHSADPQPYHSFGNGSAMRCSYIGERYNKEETVMEQAKKSAECTHNHPEGIKGAVTTAVCIYMARTGASKEEIMKYAAKQYPKTETNFCPEYKLDTYRNRYHFNETCQGSVPVAIRCFLESEDCQPPTTYRSGGL